MAFRLLTHNRRLKSAVSFSGSRQTSVDGRHTISTGYVSSVVLTNADNWAVGHALYTHDTFDELAHEIAIGVDAGAIEKMRRAAQADLIVRTRRAAQRLLEVKQRIKAEERAIERTAQITEMERASVARRAFDVASRCINLTESILTKAFRGELVPQDPNDEPASALLERIRNAKA
jgi:hypothetical protein